MSSYCVFSSAVGCTHLAAHTAGNREQATSDVHRTWPIMENSRASMRQTTLGMPAAATIQQENIAAIATSKEASIYATATRKEAGMNATATSKEASINAPATTRTMTTYGGDQT